MPNVGNYKGSYGLFHVKTADGSMQNVAYVAFRGLMQIGKNDVTEALLSPTGEVRIIRGIYGACRWGPDGPRREMPREVPAGCAVRITNLQWSWKTNHRLYLNGQWDWLPICPICDPTGGR
jgi:hypothetical protein